MFRPSDFTQTATIAIDRLPHGICPSGDGRCIYVGMENDDQLAVIDMASNALIAGVHVVQVPQAIAYVPGAVRQGAGTQNLQPLGVAGNTSHLILAPVGGHGVPSSISMFDQGVIQLLQEAVTRLKPNEEYILALAPTASGAGQLEALAAFVTNPLGSAVVNATGPIRQTVKADQPSSRRWVVVAEVAAAGATPAKVIQVQTNA